MVCSYISYYGLYSSPVTVIITCYLCTSCLDRLMPQKPLVGHVDIFFYVSSVHLELLPLILTSLDIWLDRWMCAIKYACTSSV